MEEASDKDFSKIIIENILVKATIWGIFSPGMYVSAI